MGKEDTLVVHEIYRSIQGESTFAGLPCAFVRLTGCNLRCRFCQNWQISQASPKESDNVDLMPKEVVNACIQSGSESIAYTYSEPTTFYEYAFDTATLAHDRKIGGDLPVQ